MRAGYLALKKLEVQVLITMIIHTTSQGGSSRILGIDTDISQQSVTQDTQRHLGLNLNLISQHREIESSKKPFTRNQK